VGRGRAFLVTGWLCWLALPAVVLRAQPDPGVMAQRGKQAMAEGRFAEAARIYAEVVRAMPGNAGLLLNLGMAQHMAGQQKAAAQTLEAAVKIDPGLLPANLFLGASYLKLGQAARAIAPLNRVLAAQPGMRDAVEMLAEATLGAGRHREAARHYAAWTEADPTSARAWMGLGRAQEGIAGEAFAAMEKLEPESGCGLALIGEMRHRQGQLAGAYQLYRAALAKKADLPGIHTAIASIYRETGHADWAAIEEAKEQPAGRSSGAAKPGTVEAHCEEVRRANGAAARAFARLAALPPSVEVHQFLAGNARAQGRHLDEVKHWRAALALAPGDASLRVELAYALHMAKDHAGAQQALEEALGAMPGSPRLHFMLGDTLLSQQKASEALPYLRKAVAGDARLMAARSALGRALMQLGRPAEALPHLKLALEGDTDGSLHFQAAQAYRATGQDAAAQQALAESQRRRGQAAARGQVGDAAQITPPDR
jgi:predicted Zn-dependent protease